MLQFIARTTGLGYILGLEIKFLDSRSILYLGSNVASSPLLSSRSNYTVIPKLEEHCIV